MSAVIAAAALQFHQVDLAREAMWLTAIGVVLSPILLNSGSRASTSLYQHAARF
jgi:hypothetical protein